MGIDVNDGDFHEKIVKMLYTTENMRLAHNPKAKPLTEADIEVMAYDMENAFDKLDNH